MRFLQIIAAAGLALPWAGVPALRAETPVCDHEAGTHYLLMMKGFSRAELNRLEAAFAGFPCHERHGVLPLFREGYWYETRASADRLRRDLADALEQLNLPSSVRMGSGNIIAVEKGTAGPR
jgi:hypothetical protein